MNWESIHNLKAMALINAYFVGPCLPIPISSNPACHAKKGGAMSASPSLVTSSILSSKLNPAILRPMGYQVLPLCCSWHKPVQVTLSLLVAALKLRVATMFPPAVENTRTTLFAVLRTRLLWPCPTVPVPPPW
jgi:hypothetical protein